MKKFSAIFTNECYENEPIFEKCGMKSAECGIRVRNQGKSSPVKVLFLFYEPSKGHPRTRKFRKRTHFIHLRPAPASMSGFAVCPGACGGNIRTIRVLRILFILFILSIFSFATFARNLVVYPRIPSLLRYCVVQHFRVFAPLREIRLFQRGGRNLSQKSNESGKNRLKQAIEIMKLTVKSKTRHLRSILSPEFWVLFLSHSVFRFPLSAFCFLLSAFCFSSFLSGLIRLNPAKKIMEPTQKGKTKTMKKGVENSVVNRFQTSVRQWLGLTKELFPCTSQPT
jgi:hypothetical protein